MVLLYNDKTAVDVLDCKMMKIWLSQNFLIGTAPRSLDKRHGQVRKCRRNLTSYLVVPFLLHKLQLSCDTCPGSRSCK